MILGILIFLALIYCIWDTYKKPKNNQTIHAGGSVKITSKEGITTIDIS